MGPVEAGNVINQSHSAHLGAHGLKHTGTEPILVAKWAKREKKLVFGVLEFDENCQEDLLVFFVSGEQETCKLIQSLHPSYFSDIKLNLGAWHNFHPTLSGQKRSFGGGSMCPGDVKIFCGLEL